MEIKGVSINDTHRKIIKYISEHGYKVITEDGAETIETEPITVIMTNPASGKLVSKCAPYSERYLQAYTPQVTEYTDNNFSYTYGNRFRSYPWRDDFNVDQFEICVSKLIKNPTTRRAIMHTWVDSKDSVSENPPCLQDVQFVIRNNCLNLYATFRSNDMYKAWSCNAYALVQLQYKMLNVLFDTAGELNPGIVTTHSKCPHIYTVDDQMIKEYTGICLQPTQ